MTKCCDVWKFGTGSKPFAQQPAAHSEVREAGSLLPSSSVIKRTKSGQNQFLQLCNFERFGFLRYRAGRFSHSDDNGVASCIQDAGLAPFYAGNMWKHLRKGRVRNDMIDTGKPSATKQSQAGFFSVWMFASSKVHPSSFQHVQKTCLYCENPAVAALAGLEAKYYCNVKKCWQTPCAQCASFCLFHKMENESFSSKHFELLQQSHVSHLILSHDQ